MKVDRSIFHILRTLHERPGEEESSPSHTKDSEVIRWEKITTCKGNNSELKSAANTKPSPHQWSHDQLWPSWPGLPASKQEALGHGKDEVTSPSPSQLWFLWWWIHPQFALLLDHAEKHQRAANGGKCLVRYCHRVGNRSVPEEQSILWCCKHHRQLFWAILMI